MTSLADAQPGEQVIHREGLRATAKLIVRTTPTQIVIGGATEGTFRRFQRDTGCEIGLCRNSCVEAGTADALERLRREDKRAALSEEFQRRDWSLLPLEKLEAIAAILRAN